MIITHLSSNIAGMLRNCTTRQLGVLFGMSGVEAKKELQRLQAKGDKYIGSEDCKHFNPLTGCECHLYDENGVRREE